MADDTPVDSGDEAADAAEPTAAEPELIHGVGVTHSLGQVVLHPGRDQLQTVVTALRGEGYWQCTDLCAVDYLTHPERPPLPDGVEPERFEIVVLVLNHTDRTRLRLRVQVPESDPTCPTLFRIHPRTEAMEREVYDLYGITFDGHPDMTRILMPDEWVGHPLRKDHAVGKIPVQFKAATTAR